MPHIITRPNFILNSLKPHIAKIVVFLIMTLMGVLILSFGDELPIYDENRTFLDQTSIDNLDAQLKEAANKEAVNKSPPTSSNILALQLKAIPHRPLAPLECSLNACRLTTLASYSDKSRTVSLVEAKKMSTIAHFFDDNPMAEAVVLFDKIQEHNKKSRAADQIEVLAYSKEKNILIFKFKIEAPHRIYTYDHSWWISSVAWLGDNNQEHIYFSSYHRLAK